MAGDYRLAQVRGFLGYDWLAEFKAVGEDGRDCHNSSDREAHFESVLVLEIEDRRGTEKTGGVLYDRSRVGEGEKGLICQTGLSDRKQEREKAEQKRGTNALL